MEEYVLLVRHVSNRVCKRSCGLCGKEFISLLEKKKHMKHHRTYNCEHCDMAFDRWSKYLKHRKLEHRSNEYICNECGRKFKQREHITHHIKRHLSIKSPKKYACWYEDCDRVYSRNSNLKQHIKIKHLRETHACDICEAQLVTKAKLKAHRQTHCMPKAVSIQPTKLTGRQDRKDKGVPKSSTALKIAGLLVDPVTKPVEIGEDENFLSLHEKAKIRCETRAESDRDMF